MSRCRSTALLLSWSHCALGVSEGAALTSPIICLGTQNKCQSHICLPAGDPTGLAGRWEVAGVLAREMGTEVSAGLGGLRCLVVRKPQIVGA